MLLFTFQPIRTSTPKKLSSSTRLSVLAGSELFEAHPVLDHESDEGDEDDYFSDE